MNRTLFLPLNVIPISYLLLLINVFPIRHLLLQINVLPISHILLPLKVLRISHLLLPLNVLPISHLLLLLLDVLPISHPNLLLLLQLLYPKAPTDGNKARWSKTKWKKKRSMLRLRRTTQIRKRVASCKTNTKQREKNNTTKKWKWQDKEKSITKKECTLEEEVLADLDHGSTLWPIANGYRNEWICGNHCNKNDELKAFLGLDFIMGINKLPFLGDYWSTDKYIRNEKIQNVMTRTRFQSILQNFNFSNNHNGNKSDKS